LLIFLLSSASEGGTGFGFRETSAEGKAKNKNAFIFRKTKMKASTSPATNGVTGWPHPSLCGEVGKWLIVFG
jgi:hypothetical protein